MEHKPKVEKTFQSKEILRLCHRCHHLNHHHKETDKCNHCNKAFLPLNYFQKIHDVHTEFKELFGEARELEEKDMIIGLTILW